MVVLAPELEPGSKLNCMAEDHHIWVSCSATRYPTSSLTPPMLWCPVLSMICCLSTPAWYRASGRSDSKGMISLSLLLYTSSMHVQLDQVSTTNHQWDFGGRMYHLGDLGVITTGRVFIGSQNVGFIWLLMLNHSLACSSLAYLDFSSWCLQYLEGMLSGQTAPLASSRKGENEVLW